MNIIQINLRKILHREVCYCAKEMDNIRIALAVNHIIPTNYLFNYVIKAFYHSIMDMITVPGR